MFGDGKKSDVIISLLPRQSQSASMFGMAVTERDYDVLQVWVEKGYKSQFEKIPGVFRVTQDEPEPRCFVYIDPRFDTQHIIKEVEAVVMLKKPTKRKKKEGVLGTSETTFFRMSND